MWAPSISALHTIVVSFCSGARSKTQSRPAQTGVCQARFVQNVDLHLRNGLTVKMVQKLFLTVYYFGKITDKLSMYIAIIFIIRILVAKPTLATFLADFFLVLYVNLCYI
jgi:hypothetical protein